MKKKRKTTQLITALLLAFLALFPVLPAAVTTADAADAYKVLYETELSTNTLGEHSTSGNTAVLWVRGNNYTETGYHLVRYTGSGIEILPQKYTLVGTFSPSGYAIALDETGAYGVIDANGNVILDFIYNGFAGGITDDDYVTIENDEEYTVINLKTGASTAPHALPGYFLGGNDGLLLFRTTDGYQYYSIDGSVAIPTVYDEAYGFHYGYAVVKKAGSDAYEVINTKGETVCKLKSKYEPFDCAISKEGLLCVMNWDTGEYSYMDVTTGKIKIKDRNGGRAFVNGYAVVDSGYDDTCGLIDANENLVIPFGLYNSLSDVSDTGMIWANNIIGEYPRGTITVIQLTNFSQSGATGTDPDPSQSANTGIAVTLTNVKDITTTYTGTDVTQDKKVKAKLKGTAKVGKKTIKGTWSFETTEEIVNAGDYPVTVKFTPKDTSYAEATTTITVTVNPAKVSVKKVTLEPKTVSQVNEEATVDQSSVVVQLKGLLNGETFDDVAEINFDEYKTPAKKGSQKLGYTITLTDGNYTFGGKDGKSKTGKVSAKITAG
jgi:hypothetical protein